MSVTQGVQKVLSKNIFFSYSIHRFAFSERGENKLIKFEKYDNVHSPLIINLSLPLYYAPLGPVCPGLPGAPENPLYPRSPLLPFIKKESEKQASIKINRITKLYQSLKCV